MTGSKARLRKYLRANTPRGDSDALCRRILGNSWFREAETVMAYMALATEPDLAAVLAAALSEKKTLLLPRCESDGTLTARAVSDLRELEPGPFGIPEPGAGLPVFPPERVELVLTPGMAFDRRGGRLGRGKGYYDRFLALCPGRALGVCFDGALLDRVPMEAHDRYMDGIVTDKTWFPCGLEDEKGVL